jgi:hypothetical protein
MAESLVMMWIPSSRCSYPCCSMTLCTPIGGGLMLCWLHALWLGMDVHL